MHESKADVATLLDRARSVAHDVAARHAAEVDRDARFPHEAIHALREAGVLSLPVPQELGGPGASIAQIVEALRILASADASLGLIMTMHFSQVCVIARHGHTEMLRKFLGDVQERQLLIANSNSEMSICATDRRSVCSLTPDGAGRFELSKDTPVISFGEYADAFLITTRRTPDAVANDQVLALARREDVVLQPLGPWDALGLRGSCSRPFHLNATVHADMVIDNNRHVIDATGLPVTNLMFVGSWIGMAESAATAAHRFVRKRHAGTDEPAVIARVRLAEILALLDELRGLANATMARFTVLDGTEDVSSIAFVMQLQTLKVAGSHLTSEIALQSLALCGVAGFRNDSEFTLGRAVRDSLGSLVMVSNDAVLGQNGQLALVRKEV